MASFDRDIIQIEGGYSNDPHDAGGETKYGISKRSYPNLDIKNLTVEQATEIYIRDFWNKNRIGEIADQTTANIVFRFIVHAGASRAVRLLQDSLNTFVPIVTAIRVDGALGAMTLQAIGSIRPSRLQDSLRVNICRYYLELVLNKPTQEKYFKGWIKRALM